ncbi:sialoadhesin-like isoform X2 [Salarias fasciatus]|uniref:sialoadhesin-like isoform X2 n=1 Tax=Salarias fasciatus TaxID=181472 RepID=UPI001176B2C0|nr:sialoadhesin-like isoform X2 [Salarias fasciatus]
MSLSAAVRGFVAIILSISVTQGQTDWGVNYGPPEICALKGSTVEIRSTFTYPLRKNGLNTTVEKMFWFIQRENSEPVDLRTDSQYAGRVRYDCGDRKCILSITDLTERDSAEYRFKFITNHPGGSFTGKSGVKLSVTGLKVQIKTTSYRVLLTFQPYTWSEMECSSSCVPQPSSYIWYQNGKKIDNSQKLYSAYFYSVASVSCALEGYESFSSPTLCVFSGSCTAVTYANRSICAFRGSSVSISCTYSIRDGADEPEFWFHQRETTTQPEDVQRDPRYADRALLDITKTGQSTLTIRNLTKRDSGEYRLKFGKKSDEWTNSLPGTTLTVTDIKVQVIWSPVGPKLICHSSCLRPGPSSFVWYKNGERIHSETSFLYGGMVDGADRLSCAYEGYRSDPVYAPTVPKVLMSNSGDVMKDTSISLNCSSDANPPAKYFWYKKNQTLVHEEELLFSSIQPSDTGDYHCEAENDLGSVKSTSVFISVKYAPKPPSVSVSPSGEIVEGSSVTLTCSSDANPAASYSWYRGNQTLSEEQNGLLHFTSISYKDRGNYYCQSKNQHGQTNSMLQYLDVQYGPKLPSVSVSPSGEIVEGSSVNLTCSSDANPAASYSWYREEAILPLASSQVFTIHDFRPEHTGSYYCSAQNSRGIHKSAPHLIMIAGSWKSAAIGASTVIVLTLVVLAACLYVRRSKKFTKHSKNGGTSANANYDPVNMNPEHDTPSGAAERQPTEPDCVYSTIGPHQSQAEALYSNISRFTPQTEKVDEEADLDYSVITFHSIARNRYEENANESIVCSTVNKRK